jgi:small Trp-rich protein
MIPENDHSESPELRLDYGANPGLICCIVQAICNYTSEEVMIWLYGAIFGLAVAKWVGWEPLAPWSWWWLLIPLAVVVAWFEVFERMAGFDAERKLKDATFEKAKKERIANQLKSNRTKR